MKRILALVMMVLLLCGCSSGTQITEDTQAAAESGQEKVTVYLLETILYGDVADGERSESKVFSYDENYNLDSYQCISATNERIQTGYFEQKDANGLPGQYREDWGEELCETATLTWTGDGKLTEAQYSLSPCSYRYAYDEKGALAQVQEYYEGNLSATTYFEYEGNVLKSVYCMNPEAFLCYECPTENGRIVEKCHYDEEGNIDSHYFYEYDENGNLSKTLTSTEGETQISATYTYKAVEVAPDRAQYLTEQQKYLLSIA